jgi:membrane protein implicated in regulation of membrane protease activity
MHGLGAPLYWLLRRWTGYRLYHLLALVLVLAAAVVGLAVPFWWLGERAGDVAGFAGVLIVSLAYLYVVTLVLAFSAIVVARLVLQRIRDLLQPRRFGPY